MSYDNDRSSKNNLLLWISVILIVAGVALTAVARIETARVRNEPATAKGKTKKELSKAGLGEDGTEEGGARVEIPRSSHALEGRPMDSQLVRCSTVTHPSELCKEMAVRLGSDGSKMCAPGIFKDTSGEYRELDSYYAAYVTVCPSSDEKIPDELSDRLGKLEKDIFERTRRAEVRDGSAGNGPPPPPAGPPAIDAAAKSAADPQASPDCASFRNRLVNECTGVVPPKKREKCSTDLKGALAGQDDQKVNCLKKIEALMANCGTNDEWLRARNLELEQCLTQARRAESPTSPSRNSPAVVPDTAQPKGGGK